MKSLWPISIVTIVSSLIHRSASIDCYSCDSSSDFTCSEFWDPSEDVNTKYYNDCSEVQDSKYCVKMTGVYDGKLGTKVGAMQYNYRILVADRVIQDIGR